LVDLFRSGDCAGPFPLLDPAIVSVCHPEEDLTAESQRAGRMTENLVGQLGYFGIILLLVLGGLGLPVPEEAPVILAAILSRKETMWWPAALASCLFGVLLGDFVVYGLGYIYGEKVLGFRLTRKFLTKPREAQIKGYFHRHGIKILILGRFAVGFRTAAYLTAGILRLPPLRLLAADLFAASLTTFLIFGLGFWFARWIESGLREAQHYAIVFAAAALAVFLLYRYYKGRQRAGLPVGPPVPVTDEVPVPRDDLHAGSTLAPLTTAAVSAGAEVVADILPQAPDADGRSAAPSATSLSPPAHPSPSPGSRAEKGLGESDPLTVDLES
jgi:membrane protein DedA with SNARE-associated domain